VSSQLPLFPGYLFMLADEEERSWARRTDLIANCLTVSDQRELDSDVEQIHRLIESHEPIAPVPQLQPGVAVEIVNGPLEGQRGVFVRQGSSMKLIVSINFLQQGASVEVPPDFVQAL
jgi:transcription antitermination factor NusG